ncbi:uncharacterized protein LY89DRAFT_742579 [Mollisia scopiformis]|uniref:Peptidase S28 n=1 Tax=Mollisia scopiformis TaxID=149040 RepID=A0A132B647_MOLSC|nr:uncharacterized protein LY89DRAFT_742579 [Mollisia scopiformis]KUJ07811.1 hypothetical protein LY89DRAFT_742579 [Mollisia scopiformis]
MKYFSWSVITIVGFAGSTIAQDLGPSLYNPPKQNFTQKLNHGSNDNTTFQQQYQINTAFFKPGGPILFHQSEEGPLVPLNSSVFTDYAPELGALVATLEHRFFGTSFPAGSAYNNVTTEAYAPLTLGNVMQDSIEFVNWIRQTTPGAENSKVIYTGGSYGGFLTAIALVQHSDTFYGGISGSPGLTSWGLSLTLEDNPFRYGASDWVSNVYYDANYAAALRIKDALNELKMPFQTSSSNLDWSNILNVVLVQQYDEFAQFNFPTKTEIIEIALALEVVINQTLAANSTGELLRAPILMGNSIYNGTGCADWEN